MVILCRLCDYICINMYDNVILCMHSRTPVDLYMFVYPNVCTGMSCQVIKIVDEKKACDMVGWGDVVVTAREVGQIPMHRLPAMMISLPPANLPTLPAKRPFIAICTSIFSSWIGKPIENGNLMRFSRLNSRSFDQQQT